MNKGELETVEKESVLKVQKKPTSEESRRRKNRVQRRSDKRIEQRRGWERPTKDREGQKIFGGVEGWRKQYR